MVLFIAGATHTGKTLLAQRIMKQYGFPYLSIDYLKMGLIRSGCTQLTPVSPAQDLEAYLWPIVREIAKTAVENRQSLIIEGCYIPYEHKKDFGPEYLPHIKSLWLIFSRDYLDRHFEDVLKYESAAEHRVTDSQLRKEDLAAACQRDLDACKRYGLPYALIDERYEVDLNLLA